MSIPRDYASPALSLSLAGVYRNAVRVEEEVEEGDEESGGGGGVYRGDTVDVSSENTGTGRSEEDGDEEGPLEDDGDISRSKNKKRKKYHRHTTDQIKEMEALFKESPHPDEKQRQQLSDRLGLAPRQVKFWFQNRRTQIKAMQERHENSLMKSEMEKLREENRSMRDTINKSCCPNCGSLTSYSDPTRTTEDQQLRIENAKLRAELVEVYLIPFSVHSDRETTRSYREGPGGATASSCSPGQEQDNSSSVDYYSGFLGVDKSKILELVEQAMEELTRMASAREPLWVRSLESGREILNYDEYLREFSRGVSSCRQDRRSIEASRETGVVSSTSEAGAVNQWKEMFPCMISKAATEIYFVRYCRQHNPETWAVVDVSLGAGEDRIGSSLLKCRRLPSGCIIEDKASGHCKVTWVEHTECQRGPVHSIYRPVVNSGVAFGAWHWMATLQLHCERLVFSMATNVPTKDSSGVSTLAGRKSTLKLAQRMAFSFCKAVGASSLHTWTRMPTKNGDDMRITSRKNLSDPGEPGGLILCAVSSVWLPVPASALFDFLRDDARRSEWDMLPTGGSIHTVASIAKGQDRGNSVVLQAVKAGDSRDIWFLQDSSTNSYESMVVYAPVDVPTMQSVMSGCDSGDVAVLPSGFSILPDGLDASTPVISNTPEAKPAESGGSLVTVAFQLLADTSPAAKLRMESVEAVSSLISSTIHNIKKAMRCEDG
ncbi:unnamed protein product [Spirodela intermedia]|uniref:Uncharacterized protein n=1 Tax=Spirodela intermedia TaxID=51605 RepID=A0A7I8J6Y3_SPIIN|nr:unnamed protein product [Spirodela intermedia]CAA6665987.1 unnamed protein product [Spirodela intermedia]